MYINTAAKLLQHREFQERGHGLSQKNRVSLSIDTYYSWLIGNSQRGENDRVLLLQILESQRKINIACMTTPEKDIVVFIDVLDRRTEFPLRQFENRKVSTSILRLAPFDQIEN